MIREILNFTDYPGEPKRLKEKRKWHKEYIWLGRQN
jgi:hypothetical protein